MLIDKKHLHKMSFQKNTKINVIVKNLPTKEKSEQKTKELCDFLSKVWYVPLDKKDT